MYRRFYFLVIFRVLLLVVSIFSFAFIFGKNGLFFNHFIIGTIIVVQVWELIRFVNRTNNHLARLFNALLHRDFSLTFQDEIRDRSFRDLEQSLNQVVEAYKAVKIERETQYHLLQMLVSQVNIGIIALENESEISIINPTSESLLGVKGIRNWKLLKHLNPAFASAADEIGNHGRRLIELESGGEKKLLSVDVSTTTLLDKPFRLYVIQDINKEIEQKEIEAWHKLIRILTHEIMNSVTPISSLTETTQTMLQHGDNSVRRVDELTDENISDILFSLRTIQKRSDGLLNFVESYRKLSRVPKPVKEQVEVKELLFSIEKLMHEELVRNNIHLELLQLHSITSAPIDRTLAEQVLINLITNSMHALKGKSDPGIEITTSNDARHLFIEVRDNGKGIAPKEISEIFIPFFSTRKDGSGIGLSLSKQIMNAHGGSIKVRSVVGEGTRFLLTFPLNSYNN
jgi:two-component system, NtrC family, nitrogen regulation sensor histidine kinase NtrY